jgi:aromatase
LTTSIPVRVTEHQITIAAPVRAVYEIIRDVTRWPERFGPTVHVEYRERQSAAELIQLWATANGQVKTWVSRRWLEPAAARIRFSQQVSQPPVAAMSGEWIFRPLPRGTTQVVLRHEYSAVGDEPEAVAWIERALDENTTSELAGLKGVAERLDGAEELTLSFSDSVDIAGEIPAVYEFLYQAARWPERLPHVARLELREEQPGLQQMAMTTRTADGASHDTCSVRVCLPPDQIVYKQTTTPRLMSAHTGRWVLAPAGPVTRATSRHVVVINQDAIADVLGRRSTVADARQMIREALGANSRTTLACARDHAEQGVRR